MEELIEQTKKRMAVQIKAKMSRHNSSRSNKHLSNNSINLDFDYADEIPIPAEENTDPNKKQEDQMIE